MSNGGLRHRQFSKTSQMEANSLSNKPSNNTISASHRTPVFLGSMLPIQKTSLTSNKQASSASRTATTQAISGKAQHGQQSPTSKSVGTKTYDSFFVLAVLAIKNINEPTTVHDILAFIEINFPHVKDVLRANWENGVRVALSSNENVLLKKTNEAQRQRRGRPCLLYYLNANNDIYKNCIQYWKHKDPNLLGIREPNEWPAIVAGVRGYRPPKDLVQKAPVEVRPPPVIKSSGNKIIDQMRAALAERGKNEKKSQAPAVIPKPSTSKVIQNPIRQMAQLPLQGHLQSQIQPKQTFQSTQATAGTKFTDNIPAALNQRSVHVPTAIVKPSETKHPIIQPSIPLNAHHSSQQKPIFKATAAKPSTIHIPTILKPSSSKATPNPIQNTATVHSKGNVPLQAQPKPSFQISRTTIRKTINVPNAILQPTLTKKILYPIRQLTASQVTHKPPAQNNNQLLRTISGTTMHRKVALPNILRRHITAQKTTLNNNNSTVPVKQNVGSCAQIFTRPTQSLRYKVVGPNAAVRPVVPNFKSTNTNSQVRLNETVAVRNETQNPRVIAASTSRTQQGNMVPLPKESTVRKDVTQVLPATEERRNLPILNAKTQGPIKIKHTQSEAQPDVETRTAVIQPNSIVADVKDFPMLDETPTSERTPLEVQETAQLPISNEQIPENNEIRTTKMHFEAASDVKDFPMLEESAQFDPPTAEAQVASSTLENVSQPDLDVQTDCDDEVNFNVNVPPSEPTPPRSTSSHAQQDVETRTIVIQPSNDDADVKDFPVLEDTTNFVRAALEKHRNAQVSISEVQITKDVVARTTVTMNFDDASDVKDFPILEETAQFDSQTAEKHSNVNVPSSKPVPPGKTFSTAETQTSLVKKKTESEANKTRSFPWARANRMSNAVPSNLGNCASTQTEVNLAIPEPNTTSNSSSTKWIQETVKKLLEESQQCHMKAESLVLMKAFGARSASLRMLISKIDLQKEGIRKKQRQSRMRLNNIQARIRDAKKTGGVKRELAEDDGEYGLPPKRFAPIKEEEPES